MDLLIPEMSCGHCRATVTQALQALDQAAKIEIDLEARRAVFEGQATPEQVVAALDEAGFDASVL